MTRLDAARAAIGLLRNPATRRVLDAISATRGCNQRQVADRLDVAPSAVRMQVMNLVEAGLVRTVVQGRTVHHDVGDAVLCSRTDAAGQDQSSAAGSAVASSASSASAGAS